MARYDLISETINEGEATLMTEFAGEQTLGHNKLYDSNKRIEISTSPALYETDDNINLALLGMKEKLEIKA